jgi:hypothetical protein
MDESHLNATIQCGKQKNPQCTQKNSQHRKKAVNTISRNMNSFQRAADYFTMYRLLIIDVSTPCHRCIDSLSSTYRFLVIDVSTLCHRCIDYLSSMYRLVVIKYKPRYEDTILNRSKEISGPWFIAQEVGTCQTLYTCMYRAKDVSRA